MQIAQRGPYTSQLTFIKDRDADAYRRRESDLRAQQDRINIKDVNLQGDNKLQIR